MKNNDVEDNKELIRTTARLLLIFTIFGIVSVWNVYAEENSWLESNTNVIELNISLIAKVIRGENYRLNNITIKLHEFPRSTENQKLLVFKTEPKSEIVNNTLITSINSEDLNSEFVSFKVNSVIERKRNYQNIKKVEFPQEIKKTNKSLTVYLKRTSRVNFNNEIKEKASSLVEGSPDLFTAVSRIAFWINNNMQYDLNYSKSEKDAVWVFRNMRGTCDEYSTLFIAMLRAIGIPARYVSGVAYSDMKGLEGFNPHSWAEVYFDGVGWVDFDTSYGEFGFTDATHVVLNYPNEETGTEASANYEWNGYNVRIEPKNFSLEARVLSSKFGNKAVSLKLDLMRDKVALNSYNVIYATITNNLNSYIGICFRISKNAYLSIYDSERKCVVLEPLKSKIIAWVLKTRNLEKNYIYTIPIAVYNDELSKNISLEAAQNYEEVTMEEAYNFLRGITQQDNKMNEKIGFDCEPKQLYEDEKEINCTIENKGNIVLRNLQVCFDKDCKETNLLINDKKTLVFSVENSKIGFLRSKLRFKNGNFSKVYFLEYKVLEVPKLKIEWVKAPERTRFRENFNLSVNVKTESGSVDYAIISVKHKNFDRRIVLDELKNENNISVEIPSRILNEGENNITITLSYEDKHARKYEDVKVIRVALEKLNFWQKIIATLFFLEEKIMGLIQLTQSKVNTIR